MSLHAKQRILVIEYYDKIRRALIVQRARLCGRPPARYAREVSLGSPLRSRKHRQHDDLVHQLGRIGATLTQLAAVHPHGEASSLRPAIEGALAELLAAVRRLG